MITIDLRDVPGASVGDRVTLWGNDLPVDDIAARAGTIAYELLCGISARVPRVYRD
jgi:alanine racemase